MSEHKNIPQKIRLRVYEKYDHKCAYCGCPEDWENKKRIINQINKGNRSGADAHTV